MFKIKVLGTIVEQLILLILFLLCCPPLI